GGWVDANARHRREVDDDAVVNGREAGDAVAAAADGDREIVAAREADGRDHVRGARAADDEGRRVAVVRAVPDPAGLGVAVVAGREDLTADALPQLLDGRFAEHWCEGLTHLRFPFVVGTRGVLSVASLRRLRRSLAGRSVAPRRPRRRGRRRATHTVRARRRGVRTRAPRRRGGARPPHGPPARSRSSAPAATP